MTPKLICEYDYVSETEPYKFKDRPHTLFFNVKRMGTYTNGLIDLFTSGMSRASIAGATHEHTAGDPF